MRARWTGRVRAAWESAAQDSVLKTMLPAASVHVMPVAPVSLPQAA